ncbi:interleukin-31 receptor subunit alpha-like [Phyllobates terribilis]|uniref:interleukin-31 receptor subunit alpha-like n=1 Tax=Phyllobates terribilis TaxID=111132 RepID=UPI003CCB3300
MMKHILGLLFTAHLATGITESCGGILDCHLSPDTDWNDGIFCHSVFSEKGYLEGVNCSWLPHKSSLSLRAARYKLHLVWLEYDDCGVIDTSDTSMILGKTDLETDQVTTIWVSYEISGEPCVKTNNFSILPEENCQSPNILHAVHSGNLLQIQLNMIAQVRYREITSAEWHIINVTHMAANVSLSGTLLQETYVMQQRCFKEFCFHCKWEKETIVPRELLGAPDITVTIEKLSPGKQRLTIEWKYTSHNYVDGYLVMIQRLPDSCCYTIAFNTTNTKEHLNLSVSFFNVSVTAYNKAGRSGSASTTVPPLDAPELPGKIIATYENNTIFLSWSPLFECDFVVINWGTSYLEMESKIIMEKIENYSIPGPFVTMKRYMIMIVLYDLCQCKDSTEETTYGLTYIYTEEGVPRTGPRNVTVKNVTKTSAVVEWGEIPEDDCRGFLLGYRISFDDILGNSRIDMFLNVSSQRLYQVEGLTGGHTYEVTVSGVTVTGAGAPSAPQTIQTLSYDEAELRIIIFFTCAGLVITAALLVRGFAYTVYRAKKWYFPEIPNPKHSHIFKINEAAGIKTLFMPSSSFDEEESCFDQLGVEVTQQPDSLPAETSVREMNNSVLVKTSNHHKTSHASAAKVDDYTNMMSALKVFQRMPEPRSYLQQQPRAVE